jgi:hypothetical protein
LGGLGRPDGYGQLTPKGLSLAHDLDSFAPRLVPLADDLAKLQLLLLHLCPCQHRLCPRHHYLRLQLITEQPKVHHLGLRWARRSLASASAAFWDRSEPQTLLSRQMNNDLAVLISASS